MKAKRKKKRERKDLTYLHMCPLTLVVIFGGDSEYRVLDILIFVYFSLVEAFVEIRRIVVLVSYSNTDEFRHWNRQKGETSRSWISSTLPAAI